MSPTHVDLSSRQAPNATPLAERRLMTRAELEDAVSAGVISAAVLDALYTQPKAPAPLSR